MRGRERARKRPNNIEEEKNEMVDNKKENGQFWANRTISIGEQKAVSSLLLVAYFVLCIGNNHLSGFLCDENIDQSHLLRLEEKYSNQFWRRRELGSYRRKQHKSKGTSLSIICSVTNFFFLDGTQDQPTAVAEAKVYIYWSRQ